MPNTTLHDLLDALRKYRLLEPAQLDDLNHKLDGKNVEPRALAQKLIQQGWLTPYQVHQLLQGLGKNLVLGQYTLLERLGEGGMGEVFKARHTTMGRIVALKLIRKDRLADAAAVKRFHREIQAAAQLTHPNVVHAFDADQVDGTHLFVMEYIEGFDLNQLVKDKGPLPVAHACDFIRQAALGLQHAHEKGMVHRDIKPANLLLAKNGTVKILDMGLARVARPDSDEASSTLTKEGSVMGTLDYIAPEQAMDSHTVDIRADLYSLGCTFYFLLTGKVPFPGGDALAKLMKHKLEEPVPVEKLRPDVPPNVVGVMRKLMAKQPEDRFQTPAELAAVLAQGIAGASPSAFTAATDDLTNRGFSAIASSDTIADPNAPPLRAARRRWLVRTTVGALVLCSLLGLFAFLLFRDSGSSTGTGKTVPVVDPGPPPLAIAPFDEKQAMEYQRRWADYLKTKVVEENSIGMKLAVIPPGKFTMGSSDNEPGHQGWHEGPQHEVEITQPFSIGLYEVTVGQFRKFVDDGNKPEGGDAWRKPFAGQTDEHPVVNVTWNDADAFCKWLSKKESKQYALPTEAQWECSCRAGSRTKFCFGDDDKLLVDYGWYNANTGGKTHAVGEKKANAWGLHDMHGNVWEWVADWHKADYYMESPKKDPPGPSAGTTRVLRGGSWNNDLPALRSAYRNGYSAPTHRDINVGFRVVLRR